MWGWQVAGPGRHQSTASIPGVPGVGTGQTPSAFPMDTLPMQGLAQLLELSTNGSECHTKSNIRDHQGAQRNPQETQHTLSCSEMEQECPGCTGQQLQTQSIKHLSSPSCPPPKGLKFSGLKANSSQLVLPHCQVHSPSKNRGESSCTDTCLTCSSVFFKYLYTPNFVSLCPFEPECRMLM